MKRIVLFLTVAITAFFCVTVHGQTQPTGIPQRVQHPYYQYDGFVEAKGGLLLSRRVANFTPKSQALIYDTVSGKISFYTNAWKTIQNVAYTADYTDLVNRPDLTQYVPTSRTVNGYALTANVTINKVDIGLGNVQNVDATNAINITAGTLPDARLSANVTMQGNTFNGANQLLQLDAGGKVAYANLPAALMIYKGVWDASTNNPTLINGTGVNGWVYRVHPGGTVNFGAGDITFSSGDYVIYNGSIWQKSGGGDAVTSVNGQQGVVVLSTANISEGGTNYYYTNARVQSFADTRYSLLNHEHVYSDIANLGSYTGFDVRYKSISYVPAWSDITSKPTFATVATSGAYNDLSGRPTLGTLAALNSIGNTYITDVAWSKVTGAPSFLTTETDPTIYSWAKASVKPSYTYAEIGGTVPTWNQNTTGNAASATSWGGSSANFSVSISGGDANGVPAFNVTNGRYEYLTIPNLKVALGLGSNAYTSTPYLPLSGGNLTTNSTLGILGSGSGAIMFYGAYSGSPSNPGFTVTNYAGSLTFSHNSNGGATSIGGTLSVSSSITTTNLRLDQTSGAGSGRAELFTGGTRFGALGAGNWALADGTTDFSFLAETGRGFKFAVDGSSTVSFSISPTGVVAVSNYLVSGYLQASGATGLLVLTSSSWGQSSEVRNNTDINGVGGGDYMAFKNPTGKGFTWTVNGSYVAYMASNGAFTASSIIKSGGTSSQFLKADGSVDGNTYLTSAVTSIAGTSNQIAVSAATGSVTVSLTNNVVIPGTITSSASYESSDRRLKTELTGTRLTGLIQSLQARLYEKDGRVEYGYYAQEALTIIPTAVKKRIDGYYDLSYTQVFVVKIASLEKRVMELETLLQKIYSK
jgi:hypothetical protein